MFPLFSLQPTILSTVLQVLMQRLCRDSGPRSTRRATCSLWWPLPALTCRRLERHSPIVDPGGDVERNIPTLSGETSRYALNCCNIAAYSHLYFLFIYFFFIAVTNDHDFWLHWPVWTSLTLRNNFVPESITTAPMTLKASTTAAFKKRKKKKKSHSF